MGLLNLKTDLKSLKYGLDRPDLGSSREPFIKKEIPENPPGASPDFLLRQGALIRGIEDGARIGKFLTTPKGLGFITNQNLLAAQNPKIIGNPKNLYNPLNTLLQTATNAVGGHLNLLGISGEDNSNRYNDIYKIKYNEEKTNKLLILKNSKIGGGSFTPPPSSPFAGDIGNLTGAFDILGAQAFNEGFIASIPEIPIPLNRDHGVDVSNPNLLQNYTGGPGAGITGLKTNIRRTEFTVGSQGYSGTSIEDSRNRSKEKIANSRTYFNQNNPSGSISNVTYGAGSKDKDTSVTLKTAFRKGTYASSISNYEPEIKYVTSSYRAGSDVSVDTFNKANTKALNKANFTEEAPDTQLFKFYLAAISADNPSTPRYVYWQAYIDSFSDQINSEHDTYTYVGRGYPSYKYKGFTRSISMDFTIMSPDPDQTLQIYNKLNNFLAYLTPSYSIDGYLRGNFFKLTFGDYLVNTPGIINSFTLSPIFEAGFDIGVGDYTSGKQLPKAIKVSGFQFTPIADNQNNVINANSTLIGA